MSPRSVGICETCVSDITEVQSSNPRAFCVHVAPLLTQEAAHGDPLTPHRKCTV